MTPIMRPLAWLAAGLLIPVAHADENAEPLINSCKELVRIYAKRDEQRLLASISTSRSDALRAGWCMGVLDEYRRHSSCDTDDWFTQALRIAATPIALDGKEYVTADLLEKSCAP